MFTEATSSQEHGGYQNSFDKPDPPSIPGCSLENGEIPDSRSRQDHSLKIPNETYTSFESNEDYITLDVSEELENVWFNPPKGKEIEREHSKVEGKRTITEIDYDDGTHKPKKQRLETTLRLTPWIDQVDWSSCRNLAEMYVFSFLKRQRQHFC